MAAVNDNSEHDPNADLVKVQPAPFSRVVEVMSTPGGPVIRETTHTHTGKTVVFLTPADAEAVYKMSLERVALAGRAILLPPGSLVPIPDEPERN